MGKGEREREREREREKEGDIVESLRECKSFLALLEECAQFVMFALFQCPTTVIMEH